ncbi:PIN domain-containing protein [Rhodoferax sp.]|uniref:PIN domain-containing protein n=1 Tax=Rhodoferax sp. TaxID=50421 RepID=UPI002625DD97|nr:PIN domain-containing protein [Rhodoferax sp.]MDD2810830.1 PIN domain-containing protein [Rhodoferax sp.]
MHLCFDTNVILDVILRREPFLKESAMVVALAEVSTNTGLLCATTLTNLHYVTRRTLGEAGARQAIANFLQVMELAKVTRYVLDAAVKSDMNDFEDAVLAYSAHQAGAQAIITRNLKDFAQSPVRAYTPTQFLALQAL